jgi:hypothetical protein
MARIIKKYLLYRDRVYFVLFIDRFFRIEVTTADFGMTDEISALVTKTP